VGASWGKRSQDPIQFGPGVEGVFGVSVFLASEAQSAGESRKFGAPEQQQDDDEDPYPFPASNEACKR
jgi:hypothetical protein